MQFIVVILILCLNNASLAMTNDYEVNFKYDKSDPNFLPAKKFWVKQYPELDLDKNDDKIKIGIDTYDIDGDGIKEIISTLVGSNYCGSGGCMISIIKPSKTYSGDYEEIIWHANDYMAPKFLSNRMTILQKITNNYHDIIFPRNNSKDYFKWNKNKYELSK